MTEVYASDQPEDAPGWPDGKTWRWHEPVCYLFPRGWAEVMRLPLSATQLRVLLALMGHCDWNNHCQVSCAVLGSEVGLSRSWVSRVLRTLVPHQLLILDRVEGQQQPTIVLSPALCWKGRPWHVAHARRQFLAAWALRYADAPGRGGYDHSHDRADRSPCVTPRRRAPGGGVEQREAPPSFPHAPYPSVGSLPHD